MNQAQQLQKALEVAVVAHGTTVNEDGTLYIMHPIRLMMKADTNTRKILAILHDVLEHTTHASEHLSTFLPESVMKSLFLLTRFPGEEYNNYIDRMIASGDMDAMNVKLLDLYDNIDLTRLYTVGNYELQRARKYHEAIRAIEEALSPNYTPRQ